MPFFAMPCHYAATPLRYVYDLRFTLCCLRLLRCLFATHTYAAADFVDFAADYAAAAFRLSTQTRDNTHLQTTRHHAIAF